MKEPHPNSREGREARRKQQNQPGQTPMNYNNQPKQEVTQTSIKTGIRLTDDTWERLLCALERLEYVTEQAQIQRSATRLDRHRDRDNIQADAADAQEEVNLQIQAFWYVVKPVRGDEILEWLLKDFICWLGGRERIGLQLNITDEYGIPTIDCILGIPYKSLNLPELGSSPISVLDFNVQEPLEVLNTAQIEVDRIEDDFRKNPEKKATQHTHERGSLQEGMRRLQNIAQASRQDKWFSRFDKEWWARLQKV